VQQLSSNFAFLAAHDQGLARLGALAEWAFHHDPPTTLGKLRLFAELLAKLVTARYAIEVLPRESFEAVLRLLRDRGVLPRQPAELFHYLRRVGNAAVHDNLGTPAEALSALKQARQLGIWFIRGYAGDSRFDPGPFRPPEPPADASLELRAEVVRLRSALAEQQSANEINAQRLEAEARARETAEQRAARDSEERAVWEALAAEQEAASVALSAQLRALRENAEAAAPSDRAALLQQSEQAAEAIELDEADTRLIIDAKLRAIGWQADTNRLRHALGTRPDPNGAIAVAEWPTESGPVDYVLKHKRFRRILFLVDRNALGEQAEQALDNTELEGLLKFSSTFNVARLVKKSPDKEDRVQIATVQSLVRRILYPADDDERHTCRSTAACSTISTRSRSA
jgi:type I restriction enzyme R subunit